MINNKNKICIIYSHHKLGDIIWQLPYIKSISEHHDKSVTLITRPQTQAKDIFKDINYIEQIEYNKFRKKIYYWIDVYNLYKFFRKNKYSHVYLLDKISRPAISARLAGIKYIIGIGIGSQSKWITNKKFLFKSDFKYNFSTQSKKFLELQGIKVNDKKPYIEFGEESINKIELTFNLENKKYIAFGIDAFDKWKIWYEEYFAKLADLMIENKLAGKIFLICKKENQRYAKKIIELSKYDNFIDCSDLNLLEIIKCLKHCNFFVGNDSGPLNLSSALGIKSFGLVANTSVKQLENSNADIILSKNYDTSFDVGIYKIGDNFKKDRELMKNITVEQVLTHIQGKI